MQMVNYDLIGGVSFNKGCYPGQEIVARTHYLGKLKAHVPHPRRRARPRGRHRSVCPGFGDQSAGKVVSAAPAPDGGFDALVVLQTSECRRGQGHDRRSGWRCGGFVPLPYALPLRAGRDVRDPLLHLLPRPHGPGSRSHCALYNLQARLRGQTGVAGRFLRKADDPWTWMEIYENVMDPLAFDEALAQASTATASHVSSTTAAAATPSASSCA